MLYSCTHIATVDVKWLNTADSSYSEQTNEKQTAELKSSVFHYGGLYVRLFSAIGYRPTRKQFVQFLQIDEMFRQNQPSLATFMSSLSVSFPSPPARVFLPVCYSVSTPASMNTLNEQQNTRGNI